MTQMRVAGLAVLVAGLAWPVAAADGATKPADHVKVVGAVAPSLVRVAYTLQTDKGEQPAVGWGERCPNCGAFHGGAGSKYIAEERPLEVPGFVLGPDTVVAADVMVHPRFVKSIAVWFGDQATPATITGFAVGQTAVFLKTDTPIDGAKPLAFDAAVASPYLAVRYNRVAGDWQIDVGAVGSAVAATATGRRYIPVESNTLVVDKAGVPVGLIMNEAMPIDASWKGGPGGWDVVSAERLAEQLASLEQGAGANVLRVSLHFRSPKKDKEEMSYRGGWDDEDDNGSATELDELGVLLDRNTILVLASLKPAVTARLERILVYQGEAEPIAAMFAYSLKDHGCFVATLPAPVADFRPWSNADIRACHNTVMLAGELKVMGSTRVAYFQHDRMADLAVGWRGQVYPVLRGDHEHRFLFDAEGALAALPVMRRQRGSREGSRYDDPMLTWVSSLGPVLADLAANSDPSNVPVSEEEENRLAWLGLELQPLDKELARINNVSDVTRNGEIGAMVSYVYPDSPATQAGIELGAILVRLHVDDLPAPIDVTLGRYGSGYMEMFPWDRLDEVPEQYFDQIPMPWPSAENQFTRTLTDLGFGKALRAEFVVDGQQVFKTFTVTQSPKHYDAAAKLKNDAMGVTVRDLTYEVRRYFQKTPDDPGVIISKIEPGSKASVAGIKPYEIITHVNDQPISDVTAFERAVKDAKELRLAVKRMHQGRLVRIKLDAPTTQPASE